MDYVYTAGAHMTKHLQEQCDGYDRFFSWVTSAADPTRNFMWFYPFVFPLHYPLGVRIFVATSCSDFLNVAIKWVLNEHRPFWYVKMHTDINVQLAQTPLTCETGPGSPSGHVMVTAAVWFVVIRYATRWADRGRKRRRRYLRCFVWTAYLVFLTVVGASRVFIGAHFPHQVLLGLAIGVVTGHVLDGLEVDQWGFWEYSSLSGYIALTCSTIFCALTALGLDPQHTVKLALQACDDPQYVNISSTVLYSMMRGIAAPLGLGYALSRPSIAKVLEGARRAPLWAKLVAGLAGIGVGRVLLSLPLPKRDALIYAGALTQFFFFSFAVGYGVPYVLYKNYREVNPPLKPRQGRDTESSTSDED